MNRIPATVLRQADFFLVVSGNGQPLSRVIHRSSTLRRVLRRLQRSTPEAYCVVGGAL